MPGPSRRGGQDPTEAWKHSPKIALLTTLNKVGRRQGSPALQPALFSLASPSFLFKAAQPVVCLNQTIAT